MVVLNKYSEIENYPLNSDCDVTLKVKGYSPQEKHNMLFIDCKTRDDRDITCCGPIALHNDNIEVHSGDILEFKNVKLRTHNKSGNLQFHLHGNSTINIMNYDNSKQQIIPWTSLPPPINRRGCRTPSRGTRTVIDAPTWKNTDNEKIIGTIQNELKFEQLMGKDPAFKHGVYITTLLLFTGKQMRLIISKDFGNWPMRFLVQGEIVSVIGEKMDYYGMETRFVKRGDHLDVASDDEISFSRKLKPQPRSQSIGREKKVKFLQ